MSDTNIMAYPLIRYSTSTLKGRGVLLHLFLMANHPELGESEQSLPLQISALQARALAGDLLDAATAAEMGHAPTMSRN
jgi:hypothetical protein